ncbi:molybdopterin cofactor-binding domain-containing protein [Streptomyces sp. NPDC051207]|uniref:molybdopterin cofactor-binding domain-containing protein n=1 Tax=Streptomyces sp. NPDC051207 TaxID=3154641 RepID=UPI00343526A1
MDTGLDQCLDVLRTARARRLSNSPPQVRPGELTGEGMAVTALHTEPMDGHVARARIALRADGHYDLVIGAPEFGSQTPAVLRRIAATTLHTEPDRIHLRPADTDLLDHDSGGFASTGIRITGRAVIRACRSLLKQMRDAAAAHAKTEPSSFRPDTDAMHAPGARTVVPLTTFHEHTRANR